ncbi:MAG: cell surface protein SprA, partial [Bacteroidota bacterium]
MMKNVYKLPGSGFTPNGFELDLFYEPAGRTPSRTLPGVTAAGQQTLLQILSLDQVNEDGAPQPDNQFDFLRYQINQSRGLLFFPFVKPFEDRLAEITDDDQFIFSNLYDQKKVEARRDTEKDVYRIKGEYKSAVKEVYNLGFLGVVEGSVKVRSGGSELTEGADFIVDYATGTVTITNPAFLTAGRDIRISYEKNDFAAIQKKTLLGLRADYYVNENIQLGGTLMRLSENPLVDKVGVGDEPLSNMIWGIDGEAIFEPRWLTRAIDGLPLLQTREPSRIEFKGEFAQFLPGHPNSQAYDRTRRNLQRNGLDLKSDELDGISYIDEFENFESTITLTEPGRWRLSSVPDSIAAVPQGLVGGDSLRTTYRGALGWYALEAQFARQFVDEALAFGLDDNVDAVRNIHVNEVFPNKDLRGETGSSNLQRTFDLFFDPTKLGPYNYNETELATCFNPLVSDPCRGDVWGGLMRPLPSGYTNFNLNNIEFVEFIVGVYPHGPVDNQAALVLDLGAISEDIIPNEQLNTEDGLTLNNVDQAPQDVWSRLASSIQDELVEVDEETGRTEDLGFDGLASNQDFAAYEVTESTKFSRFVEAARRAYGENSPEFRRIQQDPSGDDFHFYAENDYFLNSELYRDEDLGRSQRRFTRFFAAPELNSLVAQRQLIQSEDGGRGTDRNPNTEDMDADSNVDTDNQYFQYIIPLNPADLDFLAQPEQINDFVVRKIQNDSQIDGLNLPPPYSEWYQIRIPVRNFQRAVGGIQDFDRIQTMRLWMTGLQSAMTVRLATLELVGSQWQKSRQIGDGGNIDETLRISAISSDEAQDGYFIPNGAVRSQTRVAQTGVLQDDPEQALVLQLQDIFPGEERAIFKPFTQALDLLKYSNLRMFSHVHGGDGTGDGTGAGLEERGDLNLFIRLGLNENGDYYEYEQPLSPSSPLSETADELWQTNQLFGEATVDLNSVNIELSAFNRLKIERDDSLAAGKVTLDGEFPRSLEGRSYDFAPPGAKLRIRGNPSLSGITNIVIGVRADSLNNQIISDAEVWVNELRVSGYDEQSGWAALLNSEIQFADLATISANIRRQTDGFGGLSTGLGARQTNNDLDWALNTTFNLHKFIPERFGWNFPVSYTLRSKESTPRFSPDRGDIRLNELLAQVDENDQLDAAEKQDARNEILEEAQTYSFSQSISLPIRKTGSRSALLRNTIDALSLNVSASETESRNPSTLFNDTWQWSGALRYSYSNRRPRTFKPFWLLEGVPVLDLLGRLRMSYLPQSITASATANRSYGETRERPTFDIVQDSPVADSLRFEEAFRYPLRQTHNLNHDRSFGLDYNPFTFLSLGYDSSTNQSLRALGADTSYAVVAFDAEQGFQRFENIRLDQAIDEGLVADPNRAFEEA